MKTLEDRGRGGKIKPKIRKKKGIQKRTSLAPGTKRGDKGRKGRRRTRLRRERGSNCTTA